MRAYCEGVRLFCLRKCSCRGTLGHSWHLRNNWSYRRLACSESGTNSGPCSETTNCSVNGQRSWCGSKTLHGRDRRFRAVARVTEHTGIATDWVTAGSPVLSQGQEAECTVGPPTSTFLVRGVPRQELST